MDQTHWSSGTFPYLPYLIVLHSDWHETGCIYIYAKQSNEHYNALHISKMCSTFGSVPAAKASTRLKGSHVSSIPFSFRSFSFKVLSLLLLPTSCTCASTSSGWRFQTFFLVQKMGCHPSHWRMTSPGLPNTPLERQADGSHSNPTGISTWYEPGKVSGIHKVHATSSGLRYFNGKSGFPWRM